MKIWKSNIISNQFQNRIFFIEKKDDEYVLFVYQDSKNTHDYWQDSLEMAMDCAEGEFNVPKNSWEVYDKENNGVKK